MRKTMMLGAGLVLMTAAGAEAQQAGAPFPRPGMQRPPMPPAPRAPVPGHRWGSQVGGHWWGGANAPGGWAAYRRPFRGYRLPGYWVAPRFYVSDWSRYGLYAPTGGYNWVRYYDDAVLVDGSGQVSDWRGGLEWDGAGDDRRGPPAGFRDGYRGGPDGPPPPDRDDRREWHGGPGYPPLPPGHPPIGGPHGPSSWTSGDGRTTVTTTISGGYGAPPVIVTGGGYGYGGSVTTVTVQSAPVVTTTTTEIIEDTVTYTRPVVRRVVRHRAVRHCACRPVRVRVRRCPPAVIGS